MQDELEFYKRMDEEFLTLRVTCISCPLQIEGMVLGKRLYYRARHNRYQVYYPFYETADELPIFSGECDSFEQDSVSFALGRIADAIETEAL